MNNRQSHLRFSQRKTGIISMFLLALLALLPASDTRAQVPELPAANGSSETPEIIVSMIDKRQVKLSSLRGKVVMLDFFWTKCPHCQHHAPQVAKLYNKYRDRGLLILGLAKDEPSQIGEIRAFIREYGVTYPVGYLNTELIAWYADSNGGVPQMVLFGPDGKMTMRRVSWTTQIAKELEDEIVKLVNKRSPAATTARKRGAR